MHKIRILIADDLDLLRQMLVQQLNQIPQFEVVGQASNGRQAVELTPICRPDVILMDLDMPVMNGIIAMERILGTHPAVRVILLTAHENLVSLGRLGGAAASMPKNCTVSELIDTINAVCAPRPEGNGCHESTNKRQVALDRIAVRSGLSDRERAIVEQMVTTDLTAVQIAGHLGRQFGEEVSVAAVKGALGRALTKMRIEPRTRLALAQLVLASESDDRS